ncbi:hypothetical protein JCM11641_000158 [Rhodosporidiobolus odoratus]
MLLQGIHAVSSRQSELMSVPQQRSNTSTTLPQVVQVAEDRGARNWFDMSPGTHKNGIKSHLVGMMAEFVGTTLFLFFALGGAQVASTAANSVAGGATRATDGIEGADSVASVANTSNLLYIAFAFGISLTVSVFITAPISGGLLNPAVSLGLWLSGAMRPLRAVLLTIAQICGAMAASGLVYGLLPNGFDIRTTLSRDTSIVQGLFIEVLLTVFLMLAILILAVEKNESAPVAALGIGLALFCAELVGVNYTGGSLNPARSLGPAIVARNFNGYFWIYVVGPFLGAAIAAGLYRTFKALDYRTCLAEANGDAAAVLKAGAILSELSLTVPVQEHRPSVVSMEKGLAFEPRGPRVALRHANSATTLAPGQPDGQLNRIESMLTQLLSGGKGFSDRDFAENQV